jgi:hypothetical protein
MNGDVRALAVLPSGELVAAGPFTQAGGGACAYIARWNGSAWSPVGGGTNAVVLALTVLTNGDLAAGGSFTQAGGVACNFIARWNGSAWSPFGAGIDSPVQALSPLPGGGLVAGGAFLNAGGTPANRVARWNGSAWSAMGSGTTDEVMALLTLPNGDVIAGGRFLSAGGVFCSRVSRWNGSSWSTLQGVGTSVGVNNRVHCLIGRPAGGFFAGGLFSSAGGHSTPYLGMYAQPQPPRFVDQPDDIAVVGGDTAGFSIYASIDTTAYRWHFEGSPLSNDGRISGADTALLLIDATTPADAGAYTCVISNACGSVTSNVAILEVACPADFNFDGGVDGADVDAFFAAWEAGDSSADINRDGGIDGSDVSYFFFRWENGC